MFDRSKITYTSDFDVWSKVLINKLRALGVGGVVFNVTGSGDSPDDGDIIVQKDPKNAIETSEGRGVPWVQDEERITIADDLIEEIDAFFWDWSDKQWGGGWYNNSGGYINGAIIVDDPNPRAWVSLWEYPESEANMTGEVSL